MITETKTYVFTDDGTSGSDTINSVRASLQSSVVPVNFTVTGIQSKYSTSQINAALALTNRITYNSSTQVFTYTPPTT